MRAKRTRWIAIICFLFLILMGVSLLSLSTGAAGIRPGDIIPLLLNGQGSAAYSILVDIRLPRLILGFAVGGALSLAGVILQGMFRNSLVEPYTLGISGGAASGVCVTTILGLGHILGVYALPFQGSSGAFS